MRNKFFFGVFVVVVLVVLFFVFFARTGRAQSSRVDPTLAIGVRHLEDNTVAAVNKVLQNVDDGNVTGEAQTNVINNLATVSINPVVGDSIVSVENEERIVNIALNQKVLGDDVENQRELQVVMKGVAV